MDQGKTQTNRLEDKIFAEDTQGFTSEKSLRLYVSRKKEVEDSLAFKIAVNASTWGFKDNIKKKAKKNKLQRPVRALTA